MGIQGDGFMKKTQKGFSILAFETTKQSRILKKRMRTAALQKEIRADLRDLGNLVYNALINEQGGILEEEEVKILVENIQENKAEVERLRDSMSRLSRTRKHFQEDDFDYGFEAPAPAEETPAEPTPPAAEATEAEPTLEPEAEKEAAQPATTRRAPKKAAPRKRKQEEEAKDEAEPVADK